MKWRVDGYGSVAVGLSDCSVDYGYERKVRRLHECS